MNNRVVGIIVPDVHERYDKFMHILDKYDDAQWVVLLGDFMDSFDGFTHNTIKMVDWLAQNLQNPKYHFIWGNHDLHYAFPIPELICGGFDLNKLKLIKSKLSPAHWEAFRLFKWITLPLPNGTEYLCSHAGVHPKFQHPIHGLTKSHLQNLASEAMHKVQHERVLTPILRVGQGRGGQYATTKVGGIVWLDWHSEFVPVDGLNQIVGHSPADQVRRNKDNMCIDTQLQHVAIVREDGSLKIEEVT